MAPVTICYSKKEKSNKKSKEKRNVKTPGVAQTESRRRESYRAKRTEFNFTVQWCLRGACTKRVTMK